MKNPLIENGLRTLLAGLLLAATTLATPTVVHSHSEGERPHAHDLGERGLGRCVERHAHPTAHHPDHDAVPAGGDLHRHVYLVFLGSAIPLPDPEESNGSPGGSPSHRELLLAIPFRNEPAGSAGGSFPLQWWSTSTVDDCIDGSVVVEREGPPSIVAPAPFLCDRARHERSGVLLA